LSCMLITEILKFANGDNENPDPGESRMNKIKALFIFLFLTPVIFAGTVISEDDLYVEQIYKDYELVYGDTISNRTHVKVFVGNARVFGVVEGILTVYAGNIYVDSLAVINGAVRSLGGDVHLPEGHKAEGQVISSNLKGSSVRDYFSKQVIKEQSVTFSDNRPGGIFMPADYLPTYEPFATVNSQQGFFISFGNKLHHMGNLKNTTLYYKIGYGFSSKEAEGAVQLRIRVFNKIPVYVYGLGYHEALTQDWMNVSELENGLNYLINKQDYHTRYMAEGYRFGASIRLLNIMRLKGEYIHQNEDTLKVYHHNTLMNNINNFTVEPGRHAGYRLSASFFLGGNAMVFPGAYQMDAVFENYAPAYSSTWDYNRVRVSSQYIGTIKHAIQYRNRIVSAVVMDRDELTVTHPGHYEYFLGGMGTLRGLPYKSLQGTRMLLINQELGFSFGSDVWVLGFVDLGMTDQNIPGASLVKQLTDFNKNDLSSTIGLGIETGSTDEFGVRLDVAKDMSTGNAPWIWYCRISRTF